MFAFGLISLAAFAHSAVLAASLVLLAGAQESKVWLVAAAGLSIVALGVEFLVLRIGSPSWCRRGEAGLRVLFLLLGTAPCAWIVGLELISLKGPPGPVAVAALTALVLLLVIARLVVIERSLSPGRGRGWLRRFQQIQVALLSTLITLLVAEMVCRKLLPSTLYAALPAADSPREMFESGSRLFPRLVPGFEGRFVHPDFMGTSVRINRDGYRDRPWVEASPGGSAPTRLLALGDSLAFGMGVEAEQTFLRCLENEASGDRVLTFNAGVPGYGPAHERIILEELAGKVRPEVVVMLLYTGNDLEDSLRLQRKGRLPSETGASERPRLDPDRRRHIPESLGRLGVYRYWTGSSRVCAYTLPFFVRLAVRFGLADPRLVYNSFMIRTCAKSMDATASQALKVTVSATEEAALFSRNLGAHFLVLLAPAAMLGDGALFDRFFDLQKEYERRDYSPDILHARLTAQCERRGIWVLDLLPVLRRRQAEGQECYHPEGHWNVLGHRVAGHALARYVTERGWL